MRKNLDQFNSIEMYKTLVEDLVYNLTICFKWCSIDGKFNLNHLLKIIANYSIKPDSTAKKRKKEKEKQSQWYVNQWFYLQSSQFCSFTVMEIFLQFDSN
eukprot:TRINITY_DN6032_c3_g1_i2.p1 TRINITY_DN6032_c3_g1~~TRINITY_DN6032_c3_g1_i2.p1  ORF type:complete len:100 (+),score=5.14 TRINITY_DN6032_c3_g1_i2:3222-3521(+)